MAARGMVLVRNTDFEFDSRMRREANVALKLGFEVTVLCWSRDGSGDHQTETILPSGTAQVLHCRKRAPFGRGIRNAPSIVFFNLWVCYHLIVRRRRYQQVMACDLDVVLPALATGRLFGKRIIYDIVDSYAQNHPMPGPLKAMLRRLENWVIATVDAVLVCNEARYALVMKSGPRRCEVIHNTPDIESFTPAAGVCRGTAPRFRIAYVGTLTPEGRLLVEIAESAAAHPDMELHVGGDGPMFERFQQLAAACDHVFFYGRIPNEVALGLQSECDMLFATYDRSIEINRHAAPLKLYEAMALRKPIVVCRGTTADEVVDAHGMGIVIDYDADQFWSAAARLAAQPDTCRVMGEQGRRAYETAVRVGHHGGQATNGV